MFDIPYRNASTYVSGKAISEALWSLAAVTSVRAGIFCPTHLSPRPSDIFHPGCDLTHSTFGNHEGYSPTKDLWQAGFRYCGGTVSPVSWALPMTCHPLTCFANKQARENGRQTSKQTSKHDDSFGSSPSCCVFCGSCCSSSRRSAVGTSCAV